MQESVLTLIDPFGTDEVVQPADRQIEHVAWITLQCMQAEAS